MDRAENYLKAKKYQEAELECANVLKLDSKNLKALSILQTAYYDQGRILPAIPILLKTEALDTNNLQAPLMMARIHMAFSDVEKAQNRARWVLTKDKANLDAMLILAEAASRPEDVQEIERLIEQWPKTGSPDYHILKGKLAIARQDLALAKKEMQEALGVDSKSLKAQLSLAWIAWLQGEAQRADALFKGATRLVEDRPFESLAWATMKIRMGEIEEARKILDSVVKHHPEFLPAQVHLATIAFEQKRYKECQEMVANLQRHDRLLYTPLELQARLKLARGEAEEGTKDLERLAEKYKHVPQCHYHLGLAYLQKQDLVSARKSFEKAAALDGNFDEPVVLLAQLDVRTGNPANAVASLDRLLKQKPALTQVRTLLAEAYRATGDFENAAQQYLQLVATAPNVAEIRSLLGMTYRQQKKTGEARAAFEKALQDSPDYLPAAQQLVEMDIEARDLASASNRVARLLTRSPNSAPLLFMLATVQLASKQIAPAEASLIRAIEIQPEFLAAYELLVNIYVATKREAQALSRMEELLTKRPKDVGLLVQQALLLEKTRQIAKAIKAYERVLQINPDFILALNNAAYLYAESSGDLDKALAMSQKAVTLARGNAAMQDTLGWILLKRGDLLAALDVLKQSAAKLSDSPDSQFHYGMACFAAGQHEAGRKAFQEALKSGKDFPGKEEAQWRVELLSIENAAGLPSVARLEAIEKQRPNDTGVLLLIGQHYERINETNKAMRAYARALESSTNSAPAMLNLARLHALDSAKSETALQLAKAAYSLSRNDPKMKHALAKVAMSAENYSWAIRLFQEAAEAMPDANIQYDLAQCQFWMGNSSGAEATVQSVLANGARFHRAAEAQGFLQAVSAYRSTSAASRNLSSAESLLKAQPDWPPALLVCAMAREQSGASNEARRLYATLAEVRPRFVPGIREYARFLAVTANEPAQVQSLLDSSIKISPLDPASAAVYGEVLYLNGSYTNAIKSLKDSARFVAPSPDASYYLGLAYDKIGNRQESSRALREALRLQPQHKLAADARQVLERFEAESKLPNVKPF